MGLKTRRERDKDYYTKSLKTNINTYQKLLNIINLVI